MPDTSTLAAEYQHLKSEFERARTMYRAAVHQSLELRSDVIIRFARTAERQALLDWRRIQTSRHEQYCGTGRSANR